MVEHSFEQSLSDEFSLVRMEMKLCPILVFLSKMAAGYTLGLGEKGQGSTGGPQVLAGPFNEGSIWLGLAVNK